MRSANRLTLLLVLVPVLAIGLRLTFVSGVEARAATANVSAGPDAWSSRVVEPTAGAIVLRRSVVVSVRVGAGATSFDARVGARSVTSAFRAVDGGSVRVARLRYRTGSALRPGRNTLSIRTADRKGHSWYAQRSFVVAQPVPGLVSGLSTRPVCGAGPTVQVGLARPGLQVRMWVNGKSTAVRGSGLQRILSIDADDGLRPGANTVRVRALDPATGGYSQRQLRLAMPSSLPVAGAGPSRRAKARQVVRFDAGASAAAKPDQRLRYRWVIIARPAGSRARLHDASTAHPFLRSDRPGHYVLRVTVTTPSVHRLVAGGSVVSRLCSAAGSSDTTTLAATVSAPPLGVAINTLATNPSHDPGVQVGGTFYANQLPDGPSVQLLVLDRNTLAEVQNTSFLDVPAGASALLNQVQALTSSDLVIIAHSSVGAAGDIDPDIAATINQALGSIGGSAVPAGVSTGHVACSGSGACGAFSAIGVPGLPIGQGDVNPGLTPLGSSPGALSGYFQANLASTGFTYVSTQRVAFDTGDPGADPAVVTVGSNETGSPIAKQTYTSADLGQGGAGFFVVVLDAGNLAVQAQQTFVDNNPGLVSMAALLSGWVSNPAALVIVRSIGNVARVSSGFALLPGGWDQVDDDLQQLGGSQFYFDALNGASSAQYAQAGPPTGSRAYPGPWTQIASSERSGSGELTGLLAINPAGQFYPDESTVPDPQYPNTPLAGSLPGLISLPTSAWPDRDTPADQAVLGCIANHINPSGPLRLPMESNYTNANLSGNWASWASTITGAGYYAQLASDSGCGSFTQTDFDNVTAQLNREWNAIQPVYTMIDRLQTPLLDSSGDAPEIESVAAAINDSLTPTPQPAKYDGASLASDLLWVASTIPGLAEAADPLNFLAGGLGLASDLSQNSDGSNAQASVTTPAADLAVSLSNQFAADITGLNRDRDILLSNWTKLSVAAQNAEDLQNASANWGWDSGDAASAASYLLNATQRLAYTTLFPLHYTLYRLAPGDVLGSLNPQDPSTYQCATIHQTDSASPKLPGDLPTPKYQVFTWNPFPTVPQYGNLAIVVSGEGDTQAWVYAGSDDSFLTQLDDRASYPSMDVLNAMFATPTNGSQSPPLFNPLQFAVEAYNSAQTNTNGVAHTTSSIQAVSTKYSCRPGSVVSPQSERRAAPREADRRRRRSATRR